MVEKKKKRGQREVAVSLILAAMGIMTTLVVVSLVAAMQMKLNDARYPNIEVTVLGFVADADGNPVIYRTLRGELSMLSGAEYSFENKGHWENTTFRRTFSPDSESSGCLHGFIEIDGYPRHDFEFGLERIQQGAIVGLSFVITPDGIMSTGVLLPHIDADIQAVHPAVHQGCQTE